MSVCKNVRCTVDITVFVKHIKETTIFQTKNTEEVNKKNMLNLQME